MKPADWLAFYARHFTTVEVNATFYRLPTAAMVQRWSVATPPGFTFAVKAWRAITHERRLVDCEEPLAAFLGRIGPLGIKIGPILFQLPPRFPADLTRLGRFIDLLPPGHRYAFEFRDPSWWSDGVYALLAEKAASCVSFDLAGLRSPRLAAGSLVYVRLHGYEQRYRDRYPRRCWQTGPLGSGSSKRRAATLWSTWITPWWPTMRSETHKRSPPWRARARLMFPMLSTARDLVGKGKAALGSTAV